jgi:hypothetical protein
MEVLIVSLQLGHENTLTVEERLKVSAMLFTFGSEAD